MCKRLIWCHCPGIQVGRRSIKNKENAYPCDVFAIDLCPGLRSLVASWNWLYQAAVLAGNGSLDSSYSCWISSSFSRILCDCSRYAANITWCWWVGPMSCAVFTRTPALPACQRQRLVQTGYWHSARRCWICIELYELHWYVLICNVLMTS